MATNLLRTTWTQLDSHELRLLLHKRIGGPGQYHDREASPHRIHLSLAGVDCRITLTYSGQAIASVEPGQAFDQSQWDAIAEEIETKVLAGPERIGREYSFCSYRVSGSWRGDRSGVQILSPHPESPTAPVECTDHPFILEFPIRDADYWPITNYRRIREHRRLTLTLNTLLAGRMSVQNARRPGQSWGCFDREGGEFEYRWVTNSYFGQLGQCVLNAPSPLSAERLEVIPADRYFDEVRGIDGRGLAFPPTSMNRSAGTSSFPRSVGKSSTWRPTGSTCPRGSGRSRCPCRSAPSCRRSSRSSTSGVPGPRPGSGTSSNGMRRVHRWRLVAMRCATCVRGSSTAAT